MSIRPTRRQLLIGGPLLVAVTIVALVALAKGGTDDGTLKDALAPLPRDAAGRVKASSIPRGVIVADGRAYLPKDAEGDRGVAVLFRNEDDVAHTFTADDGLFDSHPVKPGSRFEFSFDGPRTVKFHCEIHPSMHGTIKID